MDLEDLLNGNEEVKKAIKTIRGCSMERLTPRRLFGTPSRKPIDRSTISRPIQNPLYPIIPPSPTIDLGVATPPQTQSPSPTSFVSETPSTKSSPGPARQDSACAFTGHVHSVSEPTKPTIIPPPPLRTSPSFPAGPESANKRRDQGPALEKIPESPFEFEGAVEDLNRRKHPRHIADMEPTRLQPPPAGTKARAMQQAKQMETLVAERAKRTGDEPPPYDFYELIGKGAYGRVFKG